MIPFNYRVWSKNTQTMYEVLTLTSGRQPNVVWLPDRKGTTKLSYDPDNHILMAFLGVEDMHGTDICEGDIIRKEECSPADPAFGHYGAIGVVKYSVDTMGFIIDSEDDGFYDNMGMNFSFNEIEVIGNVYENRDTVE